MASIASASRGSPGGRRAKAGEATLSLSFTGASDRSHHSLRIHRGRAEKLPGAMAGRRSLTNHLGLKPATGPVQEAGRRKAAPGKGEGANRCTR